jgi:hypothetical protein
MIEIIVSGDKRRAALDKIRAELAEIEQQIEAVSEAPMSREESIATILHSTARELEQVRFTFSGHTSSGPYAPRTMPTDKPWGTLRFLLGEAEFKRLVEERLDELSIELGPDRATRKQQIAELEAKRDALLEREERATCELEDKGLLVDRRLPAEPEARRAAVDRLLDAWDAA